VKAVASLDHEYNTRAWAPGYLATLQRHREAGEAVRAGPGARIDVPWGPRPRQKLDLFGSTDTLAVFVHGGYWQYKASTKESVAFLAPAFLRRDIGFCAVGYELCPEVDMDEMVAQLRQALRFVETSFRPARIVALGHSAGAHLAAMLALTCPSLSGACGVSGLYDLEPLVATYLNEALRMDRETARRNSPLRLVRDASPAMVLAVGGLESPEFKRQTGEFGGATGARVHEIAGKDHYAATEALLEAGSFQDDVMALFQ
jgi:arylformamidase